MATVADQEVTNDSILYMVFRKGGGKRSIIFNTIMLPLGVV